MRTVPGVETPGYFQDSLRDLHRYSGANPALKQWAKVDRLPGLGG